MSRSDKGPAAGHAKRSDFRHGLPGAAALTLAAALAAAGPGLPDAAHAAVGARPADFRLRAVTGTAWQGTFRLSEHLGKRVIVIAFFATWCRPCEVELPALEKLRAKLGDKMVSVAVSTDGPDTSAQIAATARRLRLSFPVVHDADSAVSARYNPRRAVPFLVVIDRAGKIVREKDGWTPADEPALALELGRLTTP